MNNYKLLNNVLGWATFLIATTVYLITMEPTGSFWDCGEFISAAYKLEVGHPPGAPMFMLLGRIATMFGNSEDPASYARMANALSGITSGFTIMFLFWTITAMAKKLFAETKEELTQANIFAILGAGFVGAMAYTFSDTFWFSAVEGEVYATSSMFTAMVVWLIMKWDEKVGEGDTRADRYLVLIAYLVGVAIGVHLLNLLCIPAIGYIYYFRKYKVTTQSFIIAGLVSFGALVFVQYGIIPGFITLAALFEKGFVNGLHMPFFSGLAFYIILLTGLLVGGLIYTKRTGRVNLNTILLSLAVIIIGYSSYAVILIRSNAKTPMNENNPSDVYSLLSYINRDQYGDRPLVYGQNFNTPYDRKKPYKDGPETYYKDEKNGRYSIADDGKQSKPNYDKSMCTVLPRMWSSEHKKQYINWVNLTPREATKKIGIGPNIEFMISYQMGWMWWRYFMWNFSGRQNDVQGISGPLEGNWITGINFLDSIRLGSQKDLPDTMAANKGKNKYYMLPLILGIIGLLYQAIKDKYRAWTVFLLFLFLGVLINVYLNPTPMQPRERDYAYVGSFYAFSIWVGLGVLGLYDALRNRTNANMAAIGATLVGVLMGPALMAKENWDDHDRSNRFTSADFAKNYLDSCAPNAILFTNGDNDTFPLWYVQEVEGYRTDVRVVNLSLLNTDWYIDQLKRTAYDSPAVPFSLVQDQYRQGTRDYIFADPYRDAPDTVFTPIQDVMKQLLSDKDKIQPYEGAKYFNYIKSTKVYIPVNKEDVLSTGTVSADKANKIAPIYWDMGQKGVLYKKDIMILDLLAQNNWKRPIYFAVTVGDDNYRGLEPYFQLEGLAYRLVPLAPSAPYNPRRMQGSVNTENMYKNLVEKYRWGNMNDPNVYLDETNLHMTMNFRSNFYRLAMALLKEGKKEKALKALDRCLEVMPNSTVPYDYYSLLISTAYFQAGNKDKAMEILNTVKKDELQKRDYYKSLRKPIQKAIKNSIQQNDGMLDQIATIEQQFLTLKPGVIEGGDPDIEDAPDTTLPVDSPKKMADQPAQDTQKSPKK